MSFLTNTWVRYFDRTYQQIKDSVLTRLGAKVPEITDHTENNPYVAQIGIFAGIAEMLGYYIDNGARESHIASMRLYASAVNLAQAADYKIIGSLPYMADVTFSANSPVPSNVTIPSGTVCSTETGIQYVTQADATILSGQVISNPVGASQYSVVSDAILPDATGEPNPEITIADKVVHNSIVLRVNSITWSPVDTLAYSLPTDQHFVQTVNEYKQPVIYMGNGTSGAYPGVGETLRADYKTTLGSEGKAEAGEINTIVSSLTLPVGVQLTVTNLNAAVGGQDVETLDQLKSHIPQHTRTLQRAITAKDYADILEMAPGVLKAGVYFSCGKTIQGYIVPDGGGIASQPLLDSTLAYINERKMITTKVVVLPAGELKFLIQVDVNVNPSYLNAEVAEAVKQSILKEFMPERQEINGTVYKSDIYQRIENTPGVVNSVITQFVPVPYARPLTDTTPVLDWDREITVASVSRVRWRIIVISSTSFQLVRENALVGTYPMGVPVTYQEISLQLNAGVYVAGQQWEFITYPYMSERIGLGEPSLPAVYYSDIVVNATGGM